MRKSILVATLLCVTCASLSEAVACSTLMAGRRATKDGSVLMSHSCDGDVMGLVYVMPAAIGNLLWFAYGPADTSCLVPLYAGITDLPDTWDQPANFTRIDRQQAQWNFRLVHNLAHRLGYQATIGDIRQMIRPAEEQYLQLQIALEKKAAASLQQQGSEAAAAFLTTYARDCTSQTGSAYQQLVDYLMLHYLVGEPEFASSAPPSIAAPTIPEP